MVAERGVLIPLERCIQILVSMGIKQEIRRGPACRMWRVPIFDRVCVEQLPCVVCAVARLLQPYWEIVLIETLGNKLWIAPYAFLVSRSRETFDMTYHREEKRP